MENRTEDNNTLYFIVGGLVVVAFIFGFIYFNSRAGSDDVSNIAPAAGYTAPVDGNVDTDTDSRTEFNIFDNDGERELNGSITTDE